jgi:DNA-binding CsgD family transcriptional regulator
VVWGKPHQIDVPADIWSLWAGDEAIGAALTGLKPREREIFTARHLSDKPATLDQLAKKLGVSRETVRQCGEAAERKVVKAVRRHPVGSRFHAELAANWWKRRPERRRGHRLTSFLTAQAEAPCRQIQKGSAEWQGICARLNASPLPKAHPAPLSEPSATPRLLLWLLSAPPSPAEDEPRIDSTGIAWWVLESMTNRQEFAQAA